MGISSLLLENVRFSTYNTDFAALVRFAMFDAWLIANTLRIKNVSAWLFQFISSFSICGKFALQKKQSSIEIKKKYKTEIYINKIHGVNVQFIITDCVFRPVYEKKCSRILQVKIHMIKYFGIVNYRKLQYIEVHYIDFVHVYYRFL